MKNRITQTTIASLGAGLVLTAGSVSADTLSYEVLTPMNLAPWGETLKLPKFNPGLGTMNGVQIDFKASGYSRFQVEHGVGAGAVTYDKLGATVQISPPNQIMLADVSQPAGLVWPAGSPSPSNFEGNIKSHDMLSVVASSDWSLYTGAGDFDIPVNVNEIVGTMTATGDFNQVDWIRNYGGADVSVTYDYTAVPEPGSIAMGLTTLLVGVGVWRHRRSQKA